MARIEGWLGQNRASAQRFIAAVVYAVPRLIGIFPLIWGLQARENVAQHVEFSPLRKQKIKRALFSYPPAIDASSVSDWLTYGETGLQCLVCHSLPGNP